MRTVERLGATWATRSKRRSIGSDLADDVLEVVALLQGALELNDLFFGAVAADGGADVGEQLLVVPRLLDEVLGAGADGVDHVRDGAEGGDHDDRQVGCISRMRGSRSMPLSPGSARSSSSRSNSVVRELIEPARAVGRQGDVEAFHGEQGVERLADGGSSSMMRMRATPATRVRTGRVRRLVSAA
jgi:hypothetical protein